MTAGVVDGGAGGDRCRVRAYPQLLQTLADRGARVSSPPSTLDGLPLRPTHRSLANQPQVLHALCS